MEDVNNPVTVSMNVEFFGRLILVLQDAEERLLNQGTYEIAYCLRQLRHIVPEEPKIDTGEDLT